MGVVYTLTIIPKAAIVSLQKCVHKNTVHALLGLFYRVSKSKQTNKQPNKQINKITHRNHWMEQEKSCKNNVHF